MINMNALPKHTMKIISATSLTLHYYINQLPSKSTKMSSYLLSCNVVVTLSRGCTAYVFFNCHTL